MLEQPLVGIFQKEYTGQYRMSLVNQPGEAHPVGHAGIDQLLYNPRRIGQIGGFIASPVDNPQGHLSYVVYLVAYISPAHRNGGRNAVWILRNHLERSPSPHTHAIDVEAVRVAIVALVHIIHNVHQPGSIPSCRSSTLGANDYGIYTYAAAKGVHAAVSGHHIEVVAHPAFAVQVKYNGQSRVYPLLVAVRNIQEEIITFLKRVTVLQQLPAEKSGG